ncbi:DUF6702 family protein [Polaribacter pacificus]|uniref:DUF6702 family protein n=1 Tax=Polaribacter pacificus TaxID=1775173 RepID=UPI001662EB4B|nr:DUF6702 family protein [Polaribacter pacificus]
MKSKVLVFFLVIPLFAFTTHKYYLSLTQLEYNEKQKSLEIIINVFIDDIEKALEEIHHKKFELDTKNEPKDSDTFFYQYLKKHVQFKIDGKPVLYDFIGKEYDGDIVYFYLEVKNINSLKEIDVTNDILVAEFPEQQNLIKSKVRGKHKSALLTKKEQHAVLKY